MGKPARHLWGLVPNGEQRDYASFDEMYEDPEFDTIVSLSMASVDGFPARLPKALQMLTVDWCGIKELSSSMPAGLRELYMPHNRFESIPTCLATCPDLETLDLTDNFIKVVDWVPAPVVTLNLSYNQIRAQDWTVFPATLAHLDMSYNFLEAGPIGFRGDVNLAHNNIKHVHRPYVPAVLEAKPKNTLYGNSQNVHSSAVQKSVSESVTALKAAAAACPDLPDDWFAELKAAVKKHAVVVAWSKEKTVHSVHAITMIELLKTTWRVIRAHESRGVLVEILRDEIEAGKKLCFTGRFSRVLNTLTGFVDGVAVQISSKEQLQGRVAALWKRLGDDPAPDAVHLAIVELYGFMEEACVDDEAAWLAPFEEMLDPVAPVSAPDPVVPATVPDPVAPVSTPDPVVPVSITMWQRITTCFVR
jgi:hypothetical protein